MNRFSKVLVGGVALGGLALGVGSTVGAAVAQDSGTDSRAPRDGQENRGGRRILRRHGEDLAAKLGIPVETLRAAVAEARTHRPEEPIEDRAERRAYWEGQLAGALGISVEDLRAAELAVFTEHVEEKVAEGRLTREQGDALIAAFQNGTLRETIRSIRGR